RGRPAVPRAVVLRGTVRRGAARGGTVRRGAYLGDEGGALTRWAGRARLRGRGRWGSGRRCGSVVGEGVPRAADTTPRGRCRRARMTRGGRARGIRGLTHGVSFRGVACDGACVACRRTESGPGTGMSTRNVAPPPGVGCTEIVPEW